MRYLKLCKPPRRRPRTCHIWRTRRTDLCASCRMRLQCRGRKASAALPQSRTICSRNGDRRWYSNLSEDCNAREWHRRIRYRFDERVFCRACRSYIHSRQMRVTAGSAGSLLRTLSIQIRHVVSEGTSRDSERTAKRSMNETTKRENPMLEVIGNFKILTR